MKDEVFTLNQTADILSVTKETLRRWDNSGKLKAIRHPINNYRYYTKQQLSKFEQLIFKFEEPHRQIPHAAKSYNSVELFAGAGGLALGFEQAGFSPLLLNEIDAYACKTLKSNRPHWNVVHSDIREIDFSPLNGKVDVLTGGFPCQSFSYAGKKLGLEDARGTLFFEYARAIKETMPPICIGENVRGLLTHDQGRTLSGMINILDEIGYRVLEPKLLKAIFFRVPQKRERLIIVAIRKDIKIPFKFPQPCPRLYTVKDALKAGELYPNDAPNSSGSKYPDWKKKIMDMVPPGGYWRDLPLDVQKAYMKKSFFLGGGKTGIARRMSWDEPSLTLTCNPAQKQTERCHPEETRPFTVREYARIQTFPDDWFFAGSVSQQYKQIGNAVPVNLAYEIAQSVIQFLNCLHEKGQGIK